MPTVHFLGRVLPSHFQANFPDAGTTFDMSDGQKVRINLRISESAVEAVCELEKYDVAQISELLTRSNDMARICLNMCSFSTTNGCYLVFETFIGPDQVSHPINFGDPRLMGICTSYRFPISSQDNLQDFSKMFTIIIGEPALIGALNDLATNLVTHHQTPIICGRVLDSLRKSVAPHQGAKQGWPVLHAIVNAERQYLEWVSNWSTNPRHGDWSRISDAVINELLQRTWVIFNRFLEFRKGGNQPLPESSFRF